MAPRQTLTRTWTVADRTLRPAGTPLAVATLLLAYATLRGGSGVQWSGHAGHAVGVAAVAAFLLMAAGWWNFSERTVSRGLILAAGTWSATAAVFAVDFGVTNPMVGITMCWALQCAALWMARPITTRVKSPP